MRTLKPDEISKFIDEFPFLSTILDTDTFITDPQHYQLKIHVEVADAETIFSRPDFTMPPHYNGTRDNKYIGHSYPSCFAVNPDNYVYNTIDWSYGWYSHFLKSVLIPYQPTKALVFLRVNDWWEYISDYSERKLDTSVGPWSHKEFLVTIFKAPKQGFQKLLQTANLSRNVRITDLMSVGMAAYYGNPEAIAAQALLKDAVKRFTQKVAKPLWKKLDASDNRGFKGIFGSTELLTYSIAGRVMLTFNSGKDQITLVGDDSNYRRTGLQSMDGTVDSALYIINSLINHWDLSLLEPDHTISMI